MKWYHKFEVNKEKVSWIGMDELTIWDIQVTMKNRFTGKTIAAMSHKRVSNKFLDAAIHNLKNKLKAIP